MLVYMYTASYVIDNITFMGVRIGYTISMAMCILAKTTLHQWVGTNNDKMLYIYM